MLSTKYLHIYLLLLGFSLFIGCGLAIYFSPPHLFIDQQDCFRGICVAKFYELKRLYLVGIAYGIPLGLLAMKIATARLHAGNEDQST